MIRSFKIFFISFFIFFNLIALENNNNLLNVNCCKIILLSKNEKLLTSSELKKVHGLFVKGFELPFFKEDLEYELFKICKNKKLTKDDILLIKKEIYHFFEKNNYPIVSIEIPSQEITDNVLQLYVTESRVGIITSENNRWFSSKNLENKISLKPNDLINQKKLLKDLNFINRNPFRRSSLIYSPGEKIDTTDLILYTEDRFPLRVYGGIENTSPFQLGNNRWLLGLNWGNAFFLDHILTYQYTASFNVSRFQAHTLQYIMPLFWKHILTFFGGYSKAKSNLEIENTKSTGHSSQVSGRYTIPSYISQDIVIDNMIGFDYKRTNNFIEFVTDDPNVLNTVTIAQIVLGLQNDYKKNNNMIFSSLNFYISPGGFLEDQSNKKYEVYRLGAKNYYIYVNGYFLLNEYLKYDFSFNIKSQFQISSGNLLPSEQVGIGGFDTVRGYEERELNTDDAFLISSELRSPPIKMFSRKYKSRKDNLVFLAFIDYGYGKNNTTHNSVIGHDYLLGVGPGLRYTYESFLTLRLDWGFRLHNKSSYEGGSNKVHFSIIGSY